jgi:hypothetical protein
MRGIRTINDIGLNFTNVSERNEKLTKEGAKEIRKRKREKGKHEIT